MDTITPQQVLMIGGGLLAMLALLAFAFAGPSTEKAQSRRLQAVKGRYGDAQANAMETQMRKIAANRQSRGNAWIEQYLPRPDLLQKRLERTGKNWTLSKYAMLSGGIALSIAAFAVIKGAPILLGLLGGLAVGLVIPHMAVSMQISKRLNNFNARFPDAIELMVRGLRSGLPISETLGIVSTEIPDPVGTEFRAVSDRIKIGKTMEASLEETADKIGTPEFQFFCITLAIQRETGGNLAETLMNLADVLRKRAQMKLKIRAMSSESKASAYIIGSLPFLVFAAIYMVSPAYLMNFFIDERLIIAGLGGMVWMSIGAFIMSRMIAFEI
jgi:tight adherence protein B